MKKIAITGASGLIGKELTKRFKSKGYIVYNISRKTPKCETDITWDSTNATFPDIHKLEGVDSVIHLAGENVGSGDGIFHFLGRWSPEKMRKIMDSRVQGTRLLVQSFEKLESKPKCFISTSGIGYYGYLDFSTIFDESSPKGTGFLADVSEAWECEANQARLLNPPVPMSILRLAPVISSKGGMLQKLLPLYSLGVGGPVGSGEQPLSWISMSDVIAGFEFVLNSHLSTPSPSPLCGVINLCSPNSTTNREFAQTLGRVLHRPSFLPFPAPVARLLLGQMAEEMLLGGTKVHPRKLLEGGFSFGDLELEGAIRRAIEGGE